MGKKQIIITAVMALTAFAVGFGAGAVVMSGEGHQISADSGQVVVQQEQSLTQEELLAQGYLSADILKVRINDGYVEWYDGALWHMAASVEELQKEDTFYMAQAEFETFMEQLKQENAGQQGGSLQIEAGEEDTQLLIGEKDAPPKPTETPKPRPQSAGSQTTPVQTPTPQTNQPSAGSNNNSQDNSDDDSSDDSSSGGDSSNEGSGGGDDSSGGDSSNGGSGGGDDSSGGDSGTGDGEDIGWSDDYL